jgi:hypothetical protein
MPITHARTHAHTQSLTALFQIEFGEEPEPPVGLALTEFHAIILFKESFQAICLLNDKQVLSQNFVTKVCTRLSG